MSRFLFQAFGPVVFLFCFSVTSWGKVEVPPFVSAVTDLGGFFSSSERAELENALRDYQRNAGPQVAVLIIPSLENESIESISIRVADAWKIGDKVRDDGILILVAKKERKVRIEVGQGLEGQVPDVVAKRVITLLMNPSFKEGRYAEGVARAILQISHQIDPKRQAPLHRLANMGASAQELEERDSGSLAKGSSLGPISTFISLMLGLVFVIIAGIVSRAHSGMRGTNWRHRRSSGFYGGGYGGGGFGGGGFGSFGGGGGGGFSGGGASGSW